MIRKQVYIEERQERGLKKAAREQGVPEAEIIRRGIDQSLMGVALPAPNPTAWAAEKRFIAGLSRRKAAAGRKRWTRSELHER